MGELSHARQVLEAAALAPGNQATLDALQDPERSPAQPREPLPEDLAQFIPATPFELHEKLFNRNLRSSQRSAAAGPSGMTMEHLRPLLDEPEALHSFFLIGEKLAQAQVPGSVVDIVRMERLTALSKPDGGVRGIVAGDVIRSLVARTISQQLAPTVERATSPHQYAMTTRAGCECVAHALQGLTELDPQATITSIDGVGAFDLISRRAMLDVGGWPWRNSHYLSGWGWRAGRRDDAVVVFPRPTPCSRGGGPSLDTRRTPSCVLGWHFLCVSTSQGGPDLRPPWSVFVEECRHQNPRGQDTVVESCRNQAHCVRSSGEGRSSCQPQRQSVAGICPLIDQGIKVLGPDFVARHLQTVVAEHQTLLDRIPRVKDLQSAWLLLFHCVSARANYQIPFVDPVSTAEFAEAHEDGVWHCGCDLLQIEPTQAASVRDIASLPLVLGGLGLRSAGRSRVPAHWTSWADCIPMIFERHPVVAERLLRQLEGHPTTLCLRAAASAAQSLEGVLGWPTLLDSLGQWWAPWVPPTWRIWTGSASWWLATRSGFTNRAEVQRRGTVRQVGLTLDKRFCGPRADLVQVWLWPHAHCAAWRRLSLSSLECCYYAACTSLFPNRVSLPVWPSYGQ